MIIIYLIYHIYSSNYVIDQMNNLMVNESSALQINMVFISNICGRFLKLNQCKPRGLTGQTGELKKCDETCLIASRKAVISSVNETTWVELFRYTNKTL